MFNFRKPITQVKFIVIAVLFLLFYNEFLVFILSSIEWPPFMQCGTRNKNCLKALFVSDPQIIGEINEEKWFASIARWDSDRFMQKSFKLAVEKFKPEVVIFLGDMMDEGSIAGDEEFFRYLHRLNKVFPPNDKIQYIWIPGDNDIGGEGFERVSQSKLRRFETNFKNENPISLNGINFIKINRMTHEVPQGKWSEKLGNGTNVIISHMPLLHISGTYSKTIISHLNPLLIFSGHEHNSISIKINKLLTGQKTVTKITKKDKKVKRYRIGGDTIHEFIVPTCSYRMGVEDSGFGAAIINGYGSYLDYTVLWLPQRLQILRSYLYLIYLVIICIFINISCLCLRSLRIFKLKKKMYNFI